MLSLLIFHRALSLTPCEQLFQDGKQWQPAALHNSILIERRDESFNSITGLNGSGKSNILDAICFVLGITNMTTVRAQNLQVGHQNCQLHEVPVLIRILYRILYTSEARQE
jgi:AAA15 family ATPase/GTPase